MGTNIRGQIWKRVGQSLENRAAHPHQIQISITPPSPPPPPGGAEASRYVKSAHVKAIEQLTVLVLIDVFIEPWPQASK